MSRILHAWLGHCFSTFGKHLESVCVCGGGGGADQKGHLSFPPIDIVFFHESWSSHKVKVFVDILRMLWVFSIALHAS